MEAAQSKGIVLRTLGASAIRIHTPDFAYLHEKANRRISDLDFASYKKFAKELIGHISGLGYEIDNRLYAIHGLTRQRYFAKKTGLMVDVFFDKLMMCHDVDFTGRLELDSPTITVTDLLLEKLQIVGLGGKDLVDVIMLLAGHPVEKGNEKDCINCEYISRIMGKDWGFYYTVTTNLKKTSEALPQFSYVTEDIKTRIQSRITDLLTAIEDEPKSTGWKLRARVGPKKQWYREVDSFFAAQG